ncbi:MAG: EI24 domain-containing protein [Planctomycetes bacterium]|nr:EI24 domain-containing protein [Planctomycetota bacterium]
MFHALLLAIGQLFTGPILGVLGGVVMLSVACFVGLWLGLGYVLSHWFPDSWLSTGLGGVTTLVLAWFLFPVVTSAMVGLFLDRVAAIVERQHYPELPPAKGLPFVEGLLAALRFVVVLIGANLLLLVLMLFPPIYLVAWFVVNGWLLGREYAELVLMRRHPRREADDLRRRNNGECVLAGAGFAGLAALPLFNLVLPVVATAYMVHRAETWRRDRPAAPLQADGG